jgi:hypothetical protein
MIVMFFYDSDNIDHDLDTELEFLTMKNVLAIDMMLEKDSKSNVSLHMDFKIYDLDMNESNYLSLSLLVNYLCFDM